jgi:hypothetical protein
MRPNPKADITRRQSGRENLRTEFMMYAPSRRVFRSATLQQLSGLNCITVCTHYFMALICVIMCECTTGIFLCPKDYK